MRPLPWSLDALGVKSWAKTSGASGLHLVGIESEYEFEEVHTWAIAIDRVLVERRPDLFLDGLHQKAEELRRCCWTTTKSVMGEPRPLFTALDHCRSTGFGSGYLGGGQFRKSLDKPVYYPDYAGAGREDG